LEVVSLSEHFDVVVIGGGPGGYAAALYGASAGLRIAMIEKTKVGGTCLHVGCIPAKELLETAAVYRHVAGAKEFGIDTSQPTIDWSVSQARKQKVVDRIFKGLTGSLTSREVTIYEGHGRLHADRRVTVAGPSQDGQSEETAELTGDAVILAPGSVPRTIPGFDIDGELVLTSDEVLDIDHIPASVAVIGGGAIGCEFASVFADVGSQVTILEALPKLLPGADGEITSTVTRVFKKRGIDVRTKVKVQGHTPNRKGGTTIDLGNGDTLEVDKIIVSVGRRPLTEDIGLDGTQVALDDDGFVEVDEYCRTGESGVWAVGDCINTPALAHVGFIEGIGAIKDILGEPVVPVDYGAVPWCIYCHPEVAFAGHSEQSAKEAGYEVVTAKHRYGASGRAVILGETDGVVKIIAEKNEDGTAGRILGVHMVGPWVTEQLGQGYLAVNWEATAEEVAQFIQPHPTLSEMFGETALELTGRKLHG
jgi:dihydrolipoamide dehydrogenase